MLKKMLKIFLLNMYPIQGTKTHLVVLGWIHYPVCIPRDLSGNVFANSRLPVAENSYHLK